MLNFCSAIKANSEQFGHSSCITVVVYWEFVLLVEEQRGEHRLVNELVVW